MANVRRFVPSGAIDGETLSIDSNGRYKGSGKWRSISKLSVGCFEDVLNGSMLREQADRWAYPCVQEEETGVVTYSPPFEREHIWAGVMYLYGSTR